MEYEQVIAFQKIEEKLDDIGMMVAELTIEKRKKEPKKEKKKKKEEVKNEKEEIEEEFEEGEEYK